jgi:hypothetical protein
MFDKTEVIDALCKEGADLTTLCALQRTAREVDPRRAGPEVARAAREGRPDLYVGLLLAGLTPAEIEQIPRSGLAAYRAAQAVRRFMGSSEEPRLRRMCRRRD